MNRIVFLILATLVFGQLPVLSAPEGEAQAQPGEIDAAGPGPETQFVTTVWKTADGLPVTDIHELAETPDGYLWLGTYHGVVRFDGVRFDRFLGTPAGSRYGTLIGPIATDARGQLWLAPDQVGLLRRDDHNFTEVLTNGTVFQSRVVNLCSDGTNNMFWVDANGRVGRFSITNTAEAESLKWKGSPQSRWLRDAEGTLWLSGTRSLRVYEGGKLREVAVTGSGSMVVTPGRAGGMWVAREAKLRFVRKNGVDEIATFPWKGQSRVSCLLEDNTGRLWIGTVGQGLFCYTSGVFQQVVPTGSTISCLREDSQNNLWAGTRGGGLIRIRQREFFLWDLSSGLKHEFIRSLCEDATGRVWGVTAESGLGWWRDGVWQSVGEAQGWPGYDALSVTPASGGGVWISTARRGLWRGTNEKFTKVDLGPKPPKEPFPDLLEDRQKRLWMVTDNTGIVCLQGQQLTRYTTEEGLPSNYIRRVIEDEAGDIWAGDWEGGIARLQTNRWEIIRQKSGHGDAVRSMISTNGTIWIGTSAGGLLRLRNGKTASISVEDGLPDMCIQQLLLDDRGGVWGGTPHKLFHVPLAQLDAVADGQRENIDAAVYGRSDGLPDVLFANWSDPRCWLTRDGEVWFATANGAIQFQPTTLKKSDPPRVLLEQTLFDGKPITASQLQRLRPGAGRLEFRFTAPCLTAPERVRFRYQLTGVDSKWVDAGTARSVTYASIPPGHHVFRVLASSPEGIWGLEPASVSLSVHPFFWQTNWFLAGIAALTAGGGVWTARRASVRRLSRRLQALRQEQALDRERARIAQDIHDELGANLTSIGLLADLGTRRKSDPVAVTRELDQISQTARESVAAMDAIVWALNPRNDSLDNFANYIAQFTRDFFRPTQLRTRLELPATLPAQPLPMETRHQLFLIVKEAFNNIVRHARASEVKLEIACEDRRLCLTIEDNGKGLSSKTSLEDGNGLANLRERIERLGGTLRIKTEPGRGTRLDFALPLAEVKRN